MKFILYMFLIIITIIKYIESCIRVFGCSWGKDPCMKYKDMKTCFKNADCKWGNIDEPPESPFDVEVNFGGQPGYEVSLTPHEENNGFPNNQQIINGVEYCKGRNFTPCQIGCSIF